MGSISNRTLSKGQWEIVRVDSVVPLWVLTVYNETPGLPTTYKIATGPTSSQFSDPDRTALSGFGAVINGSPSLSGTTGTSYNTELVAGDTIMLADGRIIGKIGHTPLNASEAVLRTPWSGADSVGVTIFKATPTNKSFVAGQTVQRRLIPEDESDNAITLHKYLYIQAVGGAISYDLQQPLGNVTPVRDGFSDILS